MYPDTTQSKPPRSARKKFLIIFGVVFGVVLLFILISAVTHKVQQNSISGNLTPYDDPLFSVKYPKDFIVSLPNDVQTKFNSAGDAASAEYFTIDIEPAKGALINPKTISFYKKQAEENHAKTADFKLNGTDASSIATSDSTTGLVTEKTYLFKTDYIWTFTFVYKDGSTLANSKTAILQSFTAKSPTGQSLPSQQAPTNDKSQNESGS